MPEPTPALACTLTEARSHSPLHPYTPSQQQKHQQAGTEGVPWVLDPKTHQLLWHRNTQRQIEEVSTCANGLNCAWFSPSSSEWLACPG